MVRSDVKVRCESSTASPSSCQWMDIGGGAVRKLQSREISRQMGIAEKRDFQRSKGVTVPMPRALTAARSASNPLALQQHNGVSPPQRPKPSTLDSSWAETRGSIRRWAVPVVRVVTGSLNVNLWSVSIISVVSQDAGNAVTQRDAM